MIGSPICREFRGLECFLGCPRSSISMQQERKVPCCAPHTQLVRRGLPPGLGLSKFLFQPLPAGAAWGLAPHFYDIFLTEVECNKSELNSFKKKKSKTYLLFIPHIFSLLLTESDDWILSAKNKL